MARNNTGSVRTRHTRNRRDMSISSGFGSSSAVTVRGSSAMPQSGQLPGSSRTTSGCMGQVYSVLAAGAAGSFGLERHAAVGTGTGPFPADLGMHRAGVDFA